MYAHYERRSLPYDLFSTESLTFYPHIHGQVELTFVKRGSIRVAAGGHERTLSKGELALVFPNTVHSCQSDSPNASYFAIFGAELTAEFSGIWQMYQPISPFLTAQDVHPDIPHILDELDSAPKPDSTSALLRGYLLVIVGRVLEKMPLSKATHSKDDDLLSRMIAHIDSHFHEQLTLDALAQALGVSKYHLSHLFSKKIGCNFNAYLNALRSGYAENLLHNPGFSIAEICYESGFESMSTFYRAFKLSYGQSPGCYKASLHL